MTTSARLVDEITGEVIWLERDESDPLWCDSSVFTGSIDPGFATPRAVMNNNPDTDGATDSTAHYGSKTVIWNGWITPCATDPFPALTWDKIRALAAPNRRPYMYVSEDGWIEERRMVLRGDTITAPLSRQYGPVIVAQVQWQCPGGVMESSTRHQQSVLITGGSGGRCFTHSGICWTASCQSFGPGSFGGSSIIVNNGSVIAYPSIVFTGPAKNPRVIDTQTGFGIYLNTTLVANQQVTIDTLHRTVTEVAQPPINRLAWWDFTRSSWLTLAVGPNPFSYSSDDHQGTCTFYWRDRLQ